MEELDNSFKSINESLDRIESKMADLDKLVGALYQAIFDEERNKDQESKNKNK